MPTVEAMLMIIVLPTVTRAIIPAMEPGIITTAGDIRERPVTRTSSPKARGAPERAAVLRCRGRYGACFRVRHRRSGLPPPQRRAPIAAILGLFPAYEAAGISRGVASLTFQVIAPSSEIEPDNRVARTMALRLGFIAERA